MQTPKVKHSLLAMSVFAALGLAACAGNNTVTQKETPESINPVNEATPLVANDVDSVTSVTSHTDTPTTVSAVIAATETNEQGKMGPVSYSKPEQDVIFFSFNQASLTDTELTLLKAHAEYLVAHPDIHIDINGHTDSHGPKVYNNYLSRKRAEEVAAVLINHGVDPQQIHTQGFADDQPYDMASSARQHRRVELVYPDGALATLQ